MNQSGWSVVSTRMLKAWQLFVQNPQSVHAHFVFLSACGCGPRLLVQIRTKNNSNRNHRKNKSRRETSPLRLHLHLHLHLVGFNYKIFYLTTSTTMEFAFMHGFNCFVSFSLCPLLLLLGHKFL